MRRPERRQREPRREMVTTGRSWVWFIPNDLVSPCSGWSKSWSSTVSIWSVMRIMRNMSPQWASSRMLHPKVWEECWWMSRMDSWSCMMHLRQSSPRQKQRCWMLHGARLNRRVRWRRLPSSELCWSGWRHWRKEQCWWKVIHRSHFTCSRSWHRRVHRWTSWQPRYRWSWRMQKSQSSFCTMFQVPWMSRQTGWVGCMIAVRNQRVLQRCRSEP